MGENVANIERQFSDCFFNEIRRLIIQNHYKENFITVTLLNVLWIDRLNEFIFSYTNITKTIVLVVSLDKIVYNYCKDKGVPTILLINKNYSISEVILRAKISTIYHLLENNYNVLFAEMDIFLNQNLNLLSFLEALQKEGDFDMLFSQHSFHPEINMGLFLIYSRKRPKSIFRRIYDWLDSDKRDLHPSFCGAFDQKILDYAVRGEGQLMNVCKTSSTELAMLYNHSETKNNWSYIPYYQVPHPPIKNDYAKLYAIHLWSGQSIIARYKYAEKNGFWSKIIHPVTSLSLEYNYTVKNENDTKWLDYLGYRFNSSAFMC